jgi:predicted RNase H-like nuclease
MLVAGVDGCKLGWLVVIAETDSPLSLHSVSIAPFFKDMLAPTTTCSAVGVDIPIGLMECDPRVPDREARRLLGGLRASSVFPAPVYAVLPFRDDYLAACGASEAACGKRISKQLFMILPKIKDANEVMTPALQRRVREVHPEVCFWAMNGNMTVPASKHTPEGLMQRAALLSEAYGEDMTRRPTLRGSLTDDFFDASAAAWTAARIARGEAVTLPAEPESDARGLRMEIVY